MAQPRPRTVALPPIVGDLVSLSEQVSGHSSSRAIVHPPTSFSMGVGGAGFAGAAKHGADIGATIATTIATTAVTRAGRTPAKAERTGFALLM
jgi:hypothetical protein